MTNESPSQADLELWHRIENDEAGTWRLFYGHQTGVKKHISQHLSAIDEIGMRIKRAEESECYIELMSLRLQIIDFWLRIFIENQSPQTKRQREFGRLIEQVKEHGFSPDIGQRLTAFNTSRVSAIHGFIIGAIKYDEVERDAKSCRSLVVEVVKFVIQNTGIVVTSREQLVADVGAMVIHAEGFCAEVEDGRRY
jgi:hypothetical protein